MLDVQISPIPALEALLRRHPRVRSVVASPGDAALQWSQEGWKRSIDVGEATAALRGVIELTDNNPLVCADSFGLPNAAGTLACLALGPLAEAGLIVERPTMLINVEADESNISPFLKPFGWSDGLTVGGEATDLGGAVAATVTAAITTPERLDDLDGLFEERYGRSFFVRHDEASEWHVSLVLGQPHAVYRLRISPDQPHSLLTIQLMADRDGKCGAAQVVHAFNVMCGFEESLGL
jgi:N-acetyl-gamma-glutamylphosphate reductase